MRASPSRYSPELAARICAHVADGKSLRSFCRTRGHPARPTVAHWLELHPDFRARYDAACTMRAAAAEAAGVNDSGHGGRPTDYAPDLVERVCAMRARGSTMRQIAARRDMPGYRTLYGWLKDRKDFQSMYRAASEEWAEMLAAEQLRIADEALASGWPQGDGKGAVTARDALVLAKLRIDARERQIGRMALRKYGGAEDAAGGVMSHEDALAELE